MKEIKPNLFIVGAPRSATTSIHTYLSRIPDISMSKIKEPGYFSPDTNMNKKEYLKLFQDAQIQGESTVAYLYEENTPSLIKKFNSDAKIIISLRNPVDRSYSEYILRKSRFQIDQSFQNIIEKEIKNEKDGLELYRGLYSQYVSKYLEIFGKNVHIVIFEEFIQDPKKQMEQILLFLGVEHDLSKFKPDKINKGHDIRFSILKPIMTNHIFLNFMKKILPNNIRDLINRIILHKNLKSSSMNNNDRVMLNNYFKADVKKLEHILGYNLWDLNNSQ